MVYIYPVEVHILVSFGQVLAISLSSHLAAGGGEILYIISPFGVSACFYVDMICLFVNLCYTADSVV